LSSVTEAMRASQLSQSNPQHAINCFINFYLLCMKILNLSVYPKPNCFV
jgi:hypothetical protein